MNYLMTIDAEIEQLERRLVHLRITRDVIESLARIEGGAPKPIRKTRAIGKPYETKSGIIRNPGAAERARGYIIDFLQQQTEPIKSSPISAMLSAHGIKDTTMWNVLKDLRDGGIVKWDTETRMYSITTMMSKAVAS